MNKKILIIGASGFLGFYLCLELAGRYDLIATYCKAEISKLDFINWQQLNLLETEKIPGFLNQIDKIDVIINLAAYASIDFCEKFPALSRRLNTVAAQKIADYCEEKQILFIAVSSDLVFSGANPPYSEDDFAYPLSRYAQQKQELENYLLNKNYSFLLRLPLLYGLGAGHSNFFNVWWSKLKSEQIVEAFVDEYRTPLSGATAAAGLADYLSWILENKNKLAANKILHLASNKSISRYDFGLKMCAVFGFNNKNLIPIVLKNHYLAKLRPADVSLDNEKAKLLFNFNPETILQEFQTIKNQQIII